MGTEADKVNEALAARVATLEKELRTKPAEPVVDVAKVQKEIIAKFAHALLTDAVGTLKSMGAGAEQIEVVRAQMIADKLGAAAPLQMQMTASAGPQTIAMQELREQVATLSRQVAEANAAKDVDSKHSKFKAIVETDKTKYANLTEALKVDEAGVIAALKAHGGSVDEFVADQEKHWAKFGLASKAAASAASAETADNKDLSSKVTPAPLAGNLNTVTDPAGNKPKDPEAPKQWDHKAAVAEIVAKTANKVKTM